MINKISKTKISKRTEKKRNPEIIALIDLAKKNDLLVLAKRLSGPQSQYSQINVSELGKVDESKVLVVGKVLGSGDVEKKIEISALGFSKGAVEKLKKAGCEMKSIKEFINSNKKLEGVKIL